MANLCILLYGITVMTSPAETTYLWEHAVHTGLIVTLLSACMLTCLVKS